MPLVIKQQKNIDGEVEYVVIDYNGKMIFASRHHESALKFVEHVELHEYDQSQKHELTEEEIHSILSEMPLV